MILNNFIVGIPRFLAGIPRLFATLFLVLSGIGVVGCSTIPPECKTEYAHTIMHCSPTPPRRPPTPEECTKIGGVQVWEDKRYVGCADQRDVEIIFRQYGL